MPALQVRDFPPELYEELRAYAQRNHRSIAQQTIACVEGGLARDKAAEAARATSQSPEWEATALSGADPAIPPRVREASERARTVDPYGYLRGLMVESDSELEARLAKRRKLRESIIALNEKWKQPAPTPGEIAAMIHENRDDRTSIIMENAERHAQSAAEGAQK